MNINPPFFKLKDGTIVNTTTINAISPVQVKLRNEQASNSEILYYYCEVLIDNNTLVCKLTNVEESRLTEAQVKVIANDFYDVFLKTWMAIEESTPTT